MQEQENRPQKEFDKKKSSKAEGGEVNPSRFTEGSEIDLDRSHIKTKESGSDNSDAYEANTPDIDEETLKHGRYGNEGGKDRPSEEGTI